MTTMNNLLIQREFAAPVRGEMGPRMASGWKRTDPRVSKKTGHPPLEPAAMIVGRLAGDVGRICVWGKRCSVPECWGRVEKACGPELVQSVLKITRDVQRDGVTRFDVLSLRTDLEDIVWQMRGRSERWGWYLRMHDPEKLRARRIDRAHTKRVTPDITLLPKAKVASPMPTRWNRIGTWNVNGWGRKHTAIRHVLESEHIGCLAIQETLVKATSPTLSMAGFQCLSVCQTQGEAERGVALLIHKDWEATLIPNQSPFCIMARVKNDRLGKPIIIGSVYVPGKGLGKSALEKIARQVARAREKYPDDPMVLMGDWNRIETEVRKIISRWNEHLQMLKPSNSEGGTRKGESGRVIDHVAVYEAKCLRTKRINVLRHIDTSDHFPVVLDVTVESTEGTTPRAADRPPTWQLVRRIKVRHVVGEESREAQEYQTRCSLVANATQWDVLADTVHELDEEEGPTRLQESADAFAKQWAEICHSTASANGFVDTRRKGKRHLPRHVTLALKKRGSSYKRMIEGEAGSPDNAQAQAEYRQVREEAIKLVKQHEKDEATKKLRALSKRLRHDPKAFWGWAQRECGKKGTGGTPAPSPDIRHPDTNVLLTESHEKSRAWQTHYGRLAQDVTGNSRNEQRWILWRQSPRRRELRQLNRPISMAEMRATIRRMKRHKAAGGDGVPADFIKMVLAEKTSRMATAMLSLLQYMWKHGMIPQDWGTSTVVSIPKKGDLTDMNNYRGISLIATVLKVLISIVGRRLDDQFEDKKLYSRAQAGFRRSEECATQGACLQEILQRRKLMGQRTFTMFVDIRKAYDTVPHEALFAKLDFWGVRGQSLDFIKALYAKSRIAVRVDGENAGSEPLLRGVRQGCPMSPILFNIFINDILDGLQPHGVTVPGVDSKTRIPGLLYADDLVIMAPTATALTEMANKLSKWMDDNEMSVGIKKCGVMIVKEDETGSEPVSRQWSLNGEVVPRVKSYCYLGIDVREDLDIGHIIRGRVEKGTRLLEKMRPFLLNHRIPLPMRTVVLKGVMMPTLLFGSFLAPMVQRAGDSAQELLNRILRLMLRVKATDTNLPMAPIYREFGIPPLRVSMYCERARVFRKCAHVRTLVATVMTPKTGVRGRTWGSATRDWLRNRYHHAVNAARKDATEPATSLGEWEEIAPHVMVGKLQHALWAVYDRAQTSVKSKRYMKANFAENNICSPRCLGAISATRGLALIIKARMDAIYTASTVTRFGLISSEFRHSCPFCSAKVPESLKHMVADCAKWEASRVTFGIKELLDQATKVISVDPRGSTEQTVIELLSGGEFRGKTMPSWAPRPSGEGDDDGEQFKGTDPCSRVAGFLLAVARERNRHMKRLVG